MEHRTQGSPGLLLFGVPGRLLGVLVSQIGLKDVKLEGVGNRGLGTCWMLLGVYVCGILKGLLGWVTNVI